MFGGKVLLSKKLLVFSTRVERVALAKRSRQTPVCAFSSKDYSSKRLRANSYGEAVYVCLLFSEYYPLQPIELASIFFVAIRENY